MGDPLPDDAFNLAQRYLKRADRDLYEQGLHAGDAPMAEQKVDAESEILLERMYQEKSIAEEKEDYDMARIIKVFIFLFIFSFKMSLIIHK